MKCTDFYEKEIELKRQAIGELANAVEAHGGKYEWCGEDGEFNGGADAPVVCALLDQGPTDVRIKSVCHDGDGWRITGEDCAEYGGDIDFDPNDFANAMQIQSVIEGIPETGGVRDVAGLYPTPVSYLCRDDLEYKGYDTARLTQDELMSIASKMGDYYLDCGYWDDLEDACDRLGIPCRGKEGTGKGGES